MNFANLKGCVTILMYFWSLGYEFNRSKTFVCDEKENIFINFQIVCLYYRRQLYVLLVFNRVYWVYLIFLSSQYGSSVVIPFNLISVLIFR